MKKRGGDNLGTKPMPDMVWDVVVIGGGPAGMMAAARAASRGRAVLLLEKNARLGKKLSITGGGRCNVTNNKPNVRTMLSSYKASGKFLFSTFMQHGVKETIEWFRERGVGFVEENHGRMFPETLSAETICKTLVQELEVQKVEVRSRSTVSEITRDDQFSVFNIFLTNRELVQARSCVVATGGTSRPDTGSTGEGFAWLSELGHTVLANDMSLVPLALKDKWVSRLSGVSLENVKITLCVDSKRQKSSLGKILFTHVGVSGPTVLNMSKQVGELMKEGEVTLEVDLFPTLDVGMMRANLQEQLVEKSNQKLKNILSDFVPASLVVPVLELLNIDRETPGHSVSREDRAGLAKMLKKLTLHVKGLLGADKAIVSSGGVALTEVDFRTMGSKIIPNLYLAGDVLNIERPSGGYSLQLCWSTGFVAGDNA